MASPKSVGAATGTTAVMVSDVDAHHEHAAGPRRDVIYPPTDMSCGVREYSVRDTEGAFWSFMTSQD